MEVSALSEGQPLPVGVIPRDVNLDPGPSLLPTPAPAPADVDIRSASHRISAVQWHTDPAKKAGEHQNTFQAASSTSPQPEPANCNQTQSCESQEPGMRDWESGELPGMREWDSGTSGQQWRESCDASVSSSRPAAVAAAAGGGGHATHRDWSPATSGGSTERQLSDVEMMHDSSDDQTTITRDNRVDVVPCADTMEGRMYGRQNITTTLTHSLRKRINRRPVQEKVRHKRQTLQDMTRPLKQWLYSHKDHPYPTKSDKVTLALNSQMTLTQVSNWFANARRRLKNTVKGPEMGWGKRIKLYNSCVEGNQELLSVSSHDSFWDSEEEKEKDKEAQNMDVIETPPAQVPDPQAEPLDLVSPAARERSNQQSQHVYNTPAPPPHSTPVCDVTTTQNSDVCHNSSNGHEQPSKFKHSILQRYLNDSYEHSLQVQTSRTTGSPAERHRNPSGSLSSHDYEDISVSSRSSPVREHIALDELSDFEEISRQWPHIEDRAEEDLYWKEISAALALTTLAKSRHKSTSSTE